MPKPQKIIGRCIYCDSTEGLTDEHIIPEGLKGSLILGDATCEPCRVITCGIEGRVLGQMLGHFRAAMGMRRRDRRTDTRKVEFEDGSTGEIDVSEIPPVLMLPSFGIPGFIAGRALGAPTEISLHATVVDASRLSPKLSGASLAGMGPDVFGQMLAKIALAYAVFEIGLDAMRLTVRDFILRDVTQFGHWLGGDALEPRPLPETNVLHTLQLGALPHEGKHYTTVDVRLFANFGGPRNYVILGEDLPGPPQ